MPGKLIDVGSENFRSGDTQVRKAHVISQYQDYIRTHINTLTP